MVRVVQGPANSNSLALPRRVAQGEVRFSPLPLHRPPGEHAWAIRRHLALADGDPVDVASVVAAQGWRLLRSKMLDARGHGREAALAPSAACEFIVRVDPRWSATDEWEAPFHGDNSSAIQAFRLAHELAHTFFYSMAVGGGRSPRRAHPATAAEEAFCDDFADALLVPPAIARRAVQGGAHNVVETAVRLRAPVAAVLRQAAVKSAAGRIVVSRGGTAQLVCPPAAWGFPDWWALPDVFPVEWSALVRAAPEASCLSFVIVEGGGARLSGSSVVVPL